MRFTELSLRQLPLQTAGQKRIRDEALPGFGIVVGAKTKTFFVMSGKSRRITTLGHWPETSLKDARAAARRLQASPALETKKWAFDEAKELFLEDCQKRLRPTTVERYRYALAKASASSLDGINANFSNPNELKALKAMYNWCIDAGMTDKNPFIRKRVRFAQRDRLLSDDEIVKIWSYECPPYSNIIKLLVLTGQRRNQIWRITPEWCQDGSLVFPHDVMKSNREHSVPLTDWARELIEQAPFSFNAWSKSKKRMDLKTGVDGFVLHDFRRYFSSTMAKLDVPLHVTEQLIDHRSTVSGVAAVYNRYQYQPEMRVALDLYERHLQSLLA